MNTGLHGSTLYDYHMTTGFGPFEDKSAFRSLLFCVSGIHLLWSQSSFTFCIFFSFHQRTTLKRHSSSSGENLVIEVSEYTADFTTAWLFEVEVTCSQVSSGWEQLQITIRNIELSQVNLFNVVTTIWIFSLSLPFVSKIKFRSIVLCIPYFVLFSKLHIK